MPDEEVLQDRPDRPVIRSGNTVRHPVQPWTPSVHALLRYLEQEGFEPAPRVLGVEDRTVRSADSAAHSASSEILSYLEGESGPDGWAKVVDEAGLVAAARLLRRYHDTVAGWRPDADPTWADGSVGTGGADTLVCHGDYGPWNLVWRGSRPVGILDWEYAHVAPAWHDVAYALEYVVPFRADDECLRWLRYPQPPDRYRRLELFARAYGLASTEGLVDQVIEVQRAGLDLVARLAAAGHQRQRAMVAAGELDEIERRIRWTETNRHRFGRGR